MTRLNLANWTLADYDKAAADYCAALPLEHFMEGVPQATQRKIAWVSLGLAARKRKMQVFNELLIQYPRNGNGGGLRQVVPDNMVIRSKKKLKTGSSFNVAFEGILPFWVLEYLSPSNKRKEYEDNFVKYERELKVPYYLLFDPETQDFHLYRHNGTAYEEVVPNEAGRLPVRELEMEVGLLEGWVRFWDRGELIPLPDELQQEVETLRDELDAARTLAVQAKRRADRQKQRADQEKQRADQEKQRAETAEQRAETAEQELRRLRELLEPSTASGSAAPTPR
jgi:hypothetical protein